MRYTKDHKRETRSRIVRKASERLRERGAHGIGISELMQEAGLTHGGFYAHFDSRENLLVEAVDHAMDSSIDRWRQIDDDAAPDDRLQAVVRWYLSERHRDKPGSGCAVPSLGAELAREKPATRKAFAVKLDELIRVISEQFEDRPGKSARDQAMATLATLTGTIALARAAGSGALSGAVLKAGRDAVLRSTGDEVKPGKKRRIPRAAQV